MCLGAGTGIFSTSLSVNNDAKISLHISAFSLAPIELPSLVLSDAKDGLALVCCLKYFQKDLGFFLDSVAIFLSKSLLSLLLILLIF